LIALVNCGRGSLCTDLAEGLYKCGFAVRHLPGIYDSSAKVSFRLDTVRSSSSYALDNATSIADSEISGLFVHGNPFTRKNHGESDSYLSAEKEAAMLGWIWSLRCPVINRYRPEFWFERTESIDYWCGRLDRFGLEPEWMAREGEIQSYLVCVIGSRVLWDNGVPEQLKSIDNALIQFTESLGLTYIELWISDSMGKQRVIKVEPFPTYDEFSMSKRHEIIGELVFQLGSSENAVLARTGSDSWF